MFPIPATSRWSRSASPEEPAGIGRSHPPRESTDVDVLGEQVGAELCDTSVVQGQRRPTPLRRLERLAAQHEPRFPAMLPAGPADVPPSVHAEVAPHDDAAVEAKQKVLPDRLDRLEDTTVDGSRDGARPEGRGRLPRAARRRAARAGARSDAVRPLRACPKPSQLWLRRGRRRPSRPRPFRPRPERPVIGPPTSSPQLEPNAEFATNG